MPAAPPNTNWKKATFKFIFVKLTTMHAVYKCPIIKTQLSSLSLVLRVAVTGMTI